jgi:ariadne-1
MDVEKLIEKQQQVLLELSTTLDIPVSVCGLLLRNYQWRSEKLLTDFFDNPKKVFKEAGVDINKISENIITGLEDLEMECPVCFEDFQGQEMMALESCKHFFCKGCWRNYLHVSIDDGPSCLNVTCLYKSCKFVVNEKIVNQTVDPKRKEKYTKYLSKSFIDDNPRIKYFFISLIL